MTARAPTGDYRICTKCIGLCEQILAEPRSELPSDPPGHACSFCGTHRRDTGHLISGPRVFICDRCVPHASTAVAGHRSPI
jgi:ATP-dependent protease Clp ATPase subunit